MVLTEMPTMLKGSIINVIVYSVNCSFADNAFIHRYKKQAFQHLGKTCPILDCCEE